MSPVQPPTIMGAVEGNVDEAVLCRLVTHVGAIPGTIYGRQGKAFLRKNILGYNNAARAMPWAVLVDLDACECPPALISAWLPNPQPLMRLRVAVREVEAWLMADRERLANFLSVARTRIPSRPEDENNPKQTMVNIARSSRRRAIREDMVPRDGSGISVGPAYTSRLIEFAEAVWRPAVAARVSESLHSCIESLNQLSPQSP